MRINTTEKNPAFINILSDKKQTIFLDANFFIPPDRTRLGVKRIDFDKYKEIWLEPLFDTFPNLAVHESVYDELVADRVRSFADKMRLEEPVKLRVYLDSDLSPMEKVLMQTYIYRLAPYSKYVPERDNIDDRGEIKSLSYMAVKNFLYFAANDNLPYRLIHDSEQLHTGLEHIGILQMYEVLYFLYCQGKYNAKGLKLLYKYLYYLTNREKAQNLEWGRFIEQMSSLYV